MATNKKNCTVANTQKLGLLISLSIYVTVQSCQGTEISSYFQGTTEFSIRKNYFLKKRVCFFLSVLNLLLLKNHTRNSLFQIPS